MNNIRISIHGDECEVLVDHGNIFPSEAHRKVIVLQNGRKCTRVLLQGDGGRGKMTKMEREQRREEEHQGIFSG